MGNTILIVEDDESLLPMLTYNLKKKGFNVKSASTGEEGLILIKELIPDLLILEGWFLGIEPFSLDTNDQSKNLLELSPHETS